MVPNFSSLFDQSGSNSLPMPPGGFNFGSGSNQYMSYPSMSSYPMPQSDAMSSGLNPNLYGQQYTGNTLNTIPGWNQPEGGADKLPGGMRTGPTIDPVLTGDLSQYLQSQIGQGLPGFQGQVQLPSTGQMTASGQLTAGENPLMQQLQQFFMGQGSGVTGTASPGGGTSSSPLSYVLPMWQSEVASMNQPIQEQLANLKEQFGSRGALGSSEMANAMQDYLSQTATGQQSLLGQLTMEALPQEMQMASGIQNLDQSAIQNLLQQYTTDLPQNNPLLQEQYGMATTFPPIYKPSGGVGSAILGSLGGILGGLGSIAGSGGFGALFGGDGSTGSSDPYTV